jgi:hypothetical protein
LRRPPDPTCRTPGRCFSPPGFRQFEAGLDQYHGGGGGCVSAPPVSGSLRRYRRRLSIRNRQRFSPPGFRQFEAAGHRTYREVGKLEEEALLLKLCPADTKFKIS